MRIALLYPPPWKIPAPGQPPEAGLDGPPPDHREGDLDGDFYQTPYGLFSLAAEALRAGHRAKVLNLSSYPWARVEEVIRALDADLFGLSCWTANRRGVALAAAAIKRAHPRAFVLVGGPHAAPLAPEMLAHHEAIDAVSVGESEHTLSELAARLERGAPVEGVAGLYWRDATGRTRRGPARRSIDDLDTLASPHDHFDTHIVMTSRGCPWACTFCGAESQWGRGFRAQSVEYVLDVLERTVARLPVKMVMIKDDTFTTNRKRVIELCRGIRARGLRFVWSCDTRVDLLSDELVREMRLAGCERMSLGVESGSPAILEQIDKRITVDEILASVAVAKKYGIKLRFYMMLGNRGETAGTFRETLAFLERARPHEFIFSCLSIYPGTRDFQDAEAAGWLDREVFFRESFQELKVPFDASEEDTALMNDWFREHAGLCSLHRDGVEECEQVLALLGDHAPAHLDLAGAHWRTGTLDGVERHARRALELAHPLPGLALNYLACAAARRGDYDAMMDSFSEAARRDPQHLSLIHNVERARRWFRERGPERGLPLALEASHDFRLLERTVQPTLPGPLGDDFATWDREPARPVEAEAAVARVGSSIALGSRRSLPIL
jgi:radical SAM superfamily enzyme YgiQ (UPF0313 family)